MTMEKKYILALDEGTTSARSILFDRDCNIISMSQHEIPLTYPQPGWVEQDPMAIYVGYHAVMLFCGANSEFFHAERSECLFHTVKQEHAVKHGRHDYHGRSLKDVGT